MKDFRDLLNEMYFAENNDLGLKITIGKHTITFLYVDEFMFCYDDLDADEDKPTLVLAPYPYNELATEVVLTPDNEADNHIERCKISDLTVEKVVL